MNTHDDKEVGNGSGDVETKHLDMAPSKLSSEQDNDYGFTEKEKTNIIRRIDRRLVVTVGAMYCVSLMDRTNMSAANIAGMSVELVLTGFRYVRGLVFTVSHVLTCRLEHCQPRLLHPLHHLPAPFHGTHPQARPAHTPRRHYHVLGRRHDWHGLRREP